MTVGAWRVLAWVAIILVTALYLLAALLGPSGGAGDPTTDTSGAGGPIAAFLVPVSAYAFAAVGALITLKRPRNPIGWLCLATGLAWGALIALEAYLKSADAARVGSPPGFLIALVLFSVGWIAVIGLTIFIVLVFPNGRLPSARWRVVAGLTALTLAVIAIGMLFGAENFASSGYPEVANPLATTPIAPALALLPLAVVALPVWIVAAAVSMGVRYRRASGVERLQLKWLVAAGAAVGVAYAAALALAAVAASGGDSGGPVSIGADIAIHVALASFGLVPIAIGFATLRHRLYDIDVIVNRTLVYGGATVILAAGFGLANVVSQRVLEAVSGERSDLVTAALAVGAAVAFGPMRRRIRPVVDRLLPARALLTLLFTDIVGSTQIAAEVGDERWRNLLDRYRASVRRELARAGGREIDTAGDGFFATFDRPAAGLRCAWAIRDAVRALGLQTRTGVHIGECEMRGEKVSGLAVHTAARVMAAAGDDEILVSSALRDAVRTVDAQVSDRGVHELRGVPGEWRLFRVEGVASPRA